MAKSNHAVILFHSIMEKKTKISVSYTIVVLSQGNFELNLDENEQWDFVEY